MRSMPSRGAGPRFALLTLAACIATLCRADASDWARWRGPDGNGISAEKDWKPEALAGSPKIKWKASLGVGHSSVSVAGKALFTMGNQGGKDIIYCLDPETGKEIWRFGYPCQPGDYSGPRSTPVFDGGLVYTLSRDGEAYCLDAKTGRARWQANLSRQHGATRIQWGMAGSPLVFGNIVIYNARAGGLALEKTTGRKVWAGLAGGCGYASPVLFKLKGADCVALFSAEELLVADAKTGRKLHSYSWQTQYDVNAADPAYFDGKLFITSGYDRGCTLIDLAGPQPQGLWENRNLRCHFSSPIYLDGHIYGVDGNTGSGQLKCLEAKTGDVKWSQGGGFENLTVAGGRILAIDSRGVLSVAEASPSGYKEIARASVLSGRAKNWTAPVLANGLIYCRNGDGELVCLDVR